IPVVALLLHDDVWLYCPAVRLNFIVTIGFAITISGCGEQGSDRKTTLSEVAAQATPPIPIEKKTQLVTSTLRDEAVFREWVATQLEHRGVVLMGITDQKPWPHAPE